MSGFSPGSEDKFFGQQDSVVGGSTNVNSNDPFVYSDFNKLDKTVWNPEPISSVFTKFEIFLTRIVPTKFVNFVVRKIYE